LVDEFFSGVIGERHEGQLAGGGVSSCASQNGQTFTGLIVANEYLLL